MTHDPDLLAARLLADGYCIIPDVCSSDLIEAIDRDFDPRFSATPFCEGNFYGERTKRFGALLRRSNRMHLLVRHPLVLRLVETVLGNWCERITLNLTQAVELHPGALAQIPHRDQDLWGGTKQGEYQVNVVWPLTPFNADNGATLIWPGSHRPDAPSNMTSAPTAAEMDPGSVLLFLGSTLHGGGANLTDTPRRAVIVGYCLGWLRPFENQYLVYPPDIAREFEPELAALVGYAQHRPNLGNVEGQCPSILLKGAGIDNLPAIDALRPEQTSALATYVAGQRIDSGERGQRSG